MDDLYKIAVNVMLSAVGGLITGYGGARYVAGKKDAEFEALKVQVANQSDVIHNRINKMQTEFTNAVEKLDARTIQILEKNAELKGIILGQRGESQ